MQRLVERDVYHRWQHDEQGQMINPCDLSMEMTEDRKSRHISTPPAMLCRTITTPPRPEFRLYASEGNKCSKSVTLTYPSQEQIPRANVDKDTSISSSHCSVTYCQYKRMVILGSPQGQGDGRLDVPTGSQKCRCRRRHPRRGLHHGNDVDDGAPAAR